MEMLLHHVMTVFLIGCSYMMNYMNVSLVILFCHDVSDFTGYISKTLVDTNFGKLVFTSYLVLMIAWAYTRLYVFPTQLIFYATYGNDHYDEIHGMGILGAMLHVLAILHVYWYLLLIKIGLKFISTGEQKDMQRDLDVKKE